MTNRALRGMSSALFDSDLIAPRSRADVSAITLLREISARTTEVNVTTMPLAPEVSAPTGRRELFITA